MVREARLRETTGYWLLTTFPHYSYRFHSDS
jgi:hypothetical protein